MTLSLSHLKIQNNDPRSTEINFDLEKLYSNFQPLEEQVKNKEQKLTI